MVSTDASQEREYALPGSPDLRQLDRPSFGKWLAFRACLRPRYGIVWGEIILCFLMVVGGFGAHLLVTARWGNRFGFETAAVAALWIGFWLNALLTFGHEAAHYNLSSSRKWNDLLADWTIWLFFPQTTKAYRKSHWQHHLHLGDLHDTEISYHNCLSPWFLTKTFTGVYSAILLVRYVFRRRTDPPLAALAETEQGIGGVGSNASTLVAPLRALSTHAVLVGSALCTHCFATAVAWIVAAGFVFPSLATIRQVLEHRSAEAHCETDFLAFPHGSVNRIFGKDVFSRFYGAAGFNRHLLHHWDPTVSYTRFDEMENFFRGTPLKSGIEAAHSKYSSALILLVRKALLDRS